ncbi:MAG TPA: hypothetical protein PKC60_13710 [Hydrogenophaga sp.]|uniref:hypothetical protein n=1 Tax=Hydrogenophaga sp. TaxID=1904254 RepID=UPI002C6F3C66|nr:hypothetical protein [Hydrogenophaga sp.]HMN94282.1 hypothetical protein [Hydrogenophaga sp.]HMP11006.1 hypothetical protein [Hydrogenophaga sp.]
MKKSSFVLKALVAASLAVPMLASAESQLTVGAGTAAARLNFQVVIPRILFLAVGTGNATLGTVGTIDEVVFDYTTNPTDVGGGALAPAASVTGNVVPVRVLGNNGLIEITAAGSGTGLSNGTDTIPWTQISATSSEATFPVPAVGATASPTLNAGRLTDRTATWTYSFANSDIVAPGTYTGQVTYTASMP